MRQPTLVRSAVLHVRTPLYLNAYALIASNLITSVLGLLFWSLAARMYAVEVVGVSSAVISTMLFLTGVSQLNLRMALIRLVPEAGPRTGQLVRAAYALTLAVSFVSAVLVFGAMAWTHAGTLGVDGLASAGGVLFLAGGTMAWTIFNLQDGVLAGLRRTVWVPFENGLYSAAKIVTLVAFVAAMPALGILVSWIVPMIVTVAAVTWALARHWIPAHMLANPGRALVMGRRQLLQFVAADYVGSLFALAVAALVPVVIVAISGPADGAYFYIVWTVSTSLNLLPVNLCASMTVETIHADSDLAVEARRAAIHMVRILLPLVLVVILMAEWILRIFGERYVEAGTPALRLLVLGVVPYAVNTLYLATSRIRGRGRDILVLQAVVASLTIGGSLVLLGPLGITGVAIAWLAAQTVVAAVVGVLRVWPLIRAGGHGGSHGQGAAA